MQPESILPLTTAVILAAISGTGALNQAAAGGNPGHAHAHEHHHGQMQSAVGQPADRESAVKTLNVIMTDAMRFEFVESADLKAGDVVEFRIKNAGNLRHEFSIGNQAEHAAHREIMRQMPDMVHTDGNTITLEPGETGSLTWRFSDTGEVLFACNIPGHFEAGMQATLAIMPAGETPD